MARRQIGTVGALWRYPVKSLRGESLREAMVTERGIAGDRAWALRELDRGGIMSARTWPAMLQLSARYLGDPGADPATPIQIELPDGAVTAPDNPAAPALLSGLLGRKIALERVRTERLSPDELEAMMRGETFPPNRDFFDEDVMHLVATGTLEYMRTLRAESDFDPRRFRANIYVDTGAEADGFVEDRWLDGVLEIGGQARIAGMRPAIRCAMTTHPQSGLPHDVAVLRTAWQYHQAYVGVFASVGAPGRIRLNDPVVLVS
ncbi:MAG TPA: MOSC N-terminal beta barrel domain-containing protein [Candidatus Binataceae bacterium]|nr:MOSC N-terminal beta barrel domain-containing protein [Candidatus Binataceae bacterium]